MTEIKTIQKQYLKNKTVCKVTFMLPKEAVGKAKTVFLVGDFNNWEKKATPMKILKNGNAKIAVNLKKDNEYKYRYLINGEKWENDWNADRYEPSPLAYEDNSVVHV